MNYHNLSIQAPPRSGAYVPINVHEWSFVQNDLVSTAKAVIPPVTANGFATVGGGRYPVATVPPRVLTNSLYRMSDLYPEDYQTMTECPEAYDCSQLTTANGMFDGCAALATLPTGLDTSRVTDFTRMFAGCAALTDDDFASWDIDVSSLEGNTYGNVSAVGMFEGTNVQTVNFVNATTYVRGIGLMPTLLDSTGALRNLMFDHPASLRANECREVDEHVVCARTFFDGPSVHPFADYLGSTTAESWITAAVTNATNPAAVKDATVHRFQNGSLRLTNSTLSCSGLSLVKPFTVEVWVYYTGDCDLLDLGGLKVTVMHGSLPNQSYFSINNSTTGQWFGFSNGKWVHLALAVNDDEVNLFINGLNVDFLTDVPALTGGLVLGGNGDVRFNCLAVSDVCRYTPSNQPPRTIYSNLDPDFHLAWYYVPSLT